MSEHEVVAGPGAEHTPVVLLVEDEVMIRMATAEHLRENGFDVLEAADASEAMKLVASGHPLNLVISDVQMPGDIDGVELSYHLKEVRPQLPVALVSGHLAAEAETAADRFLRKPYTAAQLIELVEELIGSEWQNRLSDSKAS